VTTQVPYRKIVIEFLNAIFGGGQETHTWWTDELPPLLRKYFALKWFPFSNDMKDLRGEIFSVGRNGRYTFFKRIGTPSLKERENVKRFE
jgi:hypothetical protein